MPFVTGLTTRSHLSGYPLVPPYHILPPASKFDRAVEAKQIDFYALNLPHRHTRKANSADNDSIKVSLSL